MEQTALNNLLPMLQKISADEVTHPTAPVDEYLIESETILSFAKEDSEAFTALGMLPDYITSVHEAVEALRHAETLWNHHRFQHSDATQEWKKLSSQAYKTRDYLLDTFRFGYHGHTDLLREIDFIAEGNGHEDMLLDLSKLASLGKKNPEPLQKINFDFTQLDEVATMSDELSKLYVEAQKDGEQKDIRDRAFTFLRDSIDELRRYGKYVHREDSEKARNYTNSIYRKRNRRRKSSLPEN